MNLRNLNYKLQKYDAELFFASNAYCKKLRTLTVFVVYKS